MWQGEKPPDLPPLLLEWKEHEPTSQMRTLLRRVLMSTYSGTWHCAGEMYKCPLRPCRFDGDGKDFRSIMGPHWRISGGLVLQRRKVPLKEKKHMHLYQHGNNSSIYYAGFPGSGLNPSMNESEAFGNVLPALCLLSCLFKKDNLLDNLFR